MSTNILQLPKFLDERGNLSFFESMNQIPFIIQRVHWIYDVPGGEERGGLAYKETEEFVVALSGSFDVVIDDGTRVSTYTLNRSYMGVYIPNGCWRSLCNFSTNSLAMIAASTKYDPNDAIRDYSQFKIWNNERSLGCYDRSGLNSVQKLAIEYKNSVEDCKIIELDRHHSNRKGDICVVENRDVIPFNIQRVYYLYDVPGGALRGGHAHKELYQLIVAASGSFTVTLDDGTNKKCFTLNRPYQGLIVKPGIWRTLDDFSSGSVCMVLASEKYNPFDYIKEYSDFQVYRDTKCKI